MKLFFIYYLGKVDKICFFHCVLLACLCKLKSKQTTINNKHSVEHDIYFQLDI